MERLALERIIQQQKEPEKRLEFIPNNLGQKMAWESQADVVYFGGRAGAGKTYLIACKAVLQHHRSLLIRKTYNEHKGSGGLLEQIEDVSKVRPNHTDGIFDFSDGRMITLGGTDRIGKFFGKPHDLIAVDEIAEVSKKFFELIIAWNRTTIKGLRCQVFCAGNPPLNPAGEWVIDYFAPWLEPNHENKAKPGELRWFANIDGKDVAVKDDSPVIDGRGRPVKPHSRTFIPGEMVSYLKETGYDLTLQNLREPYRSKLLDGDFSVRLTDDARQVIPRTWVKAAQERWKQTPRPQIPMTALGVDVARGGNDKMVMAPLYATWFGELIVNEGVDIKDGQAAATEIQRAIGNESPKIKIDILNVGYSPYDIIKDKFDVMPINFGEASKDGAGNPVLDKSKRLKFTNKRAEAYWKFMEALDPQSGKEIALPPDQELENDLCAATHTLQVSGIKIDAKDEIKEKLGRSPDKGDAVVMAWFRNEMPGSVASYIRSRDETFDSLR